VLQVELLFDDKVLRNLVLIDVVSDRSLVAGSVSFVDRGDGSFSWRLEHLKFLSNTMDLYIQDYRTRNTFSGKDVKEGLIMTPAHSSRTVLLKQKILCSGSNHVKRFDEQEFRIPFDIKFGNHHLVYPIEFKLGNGNVVASRVRPGKDTSSIPHFQSYTFEMFEEWSKQLVRYSKFAKAVAIDSIGFDSYFQVSRFKTWLMHTLGATGWIVEATQDFALLSIECDHELGSDECMVCERFKEYKIKHKVDYSYHVGEPLRVDVTKHYPGQKVVSVPKMPLTKHPHNNIQGKQSRFRKRK